MSYYRIYSYPFAECQYKHLYFYGCRGGGKAGEKQKREEAAVDIRLAESLARTRRIVRDLILCNPFDMFCTFTFDMSKVDRYDYKACSAALRKFFNNYRSRRSPDFRYIIIPEFHKDGAIHFHGLLRGINPDDLFVPDEILKREGEELKLVPNTKQYVRWKSYKLGYFDCSAIKNVAACATYIAKYITKDLAALPGGLRLVLHSENLHKPELIFDCDDIPRLFDPDYVGEFCAIKYTNELYDLVSEWYNVCCSDLSDPIDDPEDPAQIFIPITGEQLKLVTK